MAATNAIPKRKGVRRLITPYYSLPTPSAGGRKTTKERPQHRVKGKFRSKFRCKRVSLEFTGVRLGGGEEEEEEDGEEEEEKRRRRRKKKRRSCCCCGRRSTNILSSTTNDDHR